MSTTSEASSGLTYSPTEACTWTTFFNVSAENRNRTIVPALTTQTRCTGYMHVFNRRFSEANPVWWHKLIRDWTKTDYAFFSVFTWILVFSLLVLMRLIEGRTLDLVFASVFSFVMIPFELIVVAAFQKYSSNTTDISSYPALSPNDFEEDKLLKKDKSLVFFYAEWSPFCRKSFHLLKSLDGSQSKVFRVDLSDENNPLWDSLKFKVVPTLVAFKDGKEFWRANGISMVGLREKDFKHAVIAAS